MVLYKLNNVIKIKKNVKYFTKKFNKMTKIYNKREPFN